MRIINASTQLLTFNYRSRLQRGLAHCAISTRHLNTSQSICKFSSRGELSRLNRVRYVDNILKRTSKVEEQVTVEPDGSWSTNGSFNTSRNNHPTSDDDNGDGDDDDDIVELPDTRVSSLKQQAAYPNSFARTPPQSSREDSLASSATRSGKRPASEVIDLTLSDDDGDEAPPLKFKRSSAITDNSRPRYHETSPWSALRPPSQSYSPYPDWSNATT